MRTSSPAMGLVVVVGGLLAITLLAFGVVGSWLDWVVVSQTSSLQPLPSSDVLGDYLTGVLWAVLLTGVVGIWGGAVRFRGPLLVVWRAKVLAALGFMLFFDYTYGTDVDGYYGHALLRGFAFEGFEIGKGTENLRTLTWLHLQVLSDSYHATRLTFALIGLVAVYLVYRGGVMFLGREDRRLFYVLALSPSVVFWSSIVGKDPITFFGVSAYVYGVLGWHRAARARYLLWIALGITTAVFVRAWLGPILLLPLAVLGAGRRAGIMRRAVFVSLGIAGAAAAPIVIEMTIGIEAVRYDEVLATTNTLARSLEPGGSTLEMPELSGAGDVIAFAPLGVFTVLFRPLPGEIPTAFGLMAGLENAFLLLLLLRVVWRTRLRDLKDPLVVWGLAVVLGWAFFYSFSTYQNLGTAVRHRVEIYPLLVGLLLYLGRRREDTARGGSGKRWRAGMVATGSR